MAKIPTGTQLTSLDKAFRKKPYKILGQLRKSDSVHQDKILNRWFITDYNIIQDLLRNNDFGVDARKSEENSFARSIADTESETKPSMLGLDNPDHRRLRSFVSGAFSKTSVEKLRPSIESIVNHVLEPLIHKKSFDIISEFANPVAFFVLAEIMGVDPSEQEELQQWVSIKAQVFDPVRTDTTSENIQHVDACLRTLIERLIMERRAAPKNDLITQLVKENEKGEMLSTDEIVTMCSLLLAAGIVTTTDLIGNGILALLNNPEQHKKLIENPALIEDAVEEMLRFDSPVIQTGRIALKDKLINGRSITSGASISLSLGAANHDPEIYKEPHIFNIERKDNHHKSFGGGIHLCLGHILARLEAQVSIMKLIQTFPDLQLSQSSVSRKPLPILNGYQKIEVITGATLSKSL